MPYDAYLWHVVLPEDVNFLEAMYISFLIRLAERKLGVRYRRILDLAGGCGRHHKYLREEGFEVYGIDASEEMVELAKERNKGFEEYYALGDMRELEYEEEFDVVLSWYTSFGYFTHEENVAVLKGVYRALRPGGLLILDVPVKWREGVGIIDHGEYLEVDVRRRVDDYVFALDFKLYKKGEEGLTLVGGLRLNLTVYPPEVLRQMLKDAGFELLYALANRGSYAVSDFNLADLVERGVRRLVWLAYKKL